MTSATREHFRQRRISEIILQFKEEMVDDRWRVRNRATGQLVDQADYDNEPFARAKARQEAAPLIEKLYMPDRQAAQQRVKNLLAVHGANVEALTDAIIDYFEGCKA